MTLARFWAIAGSETLSQPPSPPPDRGNRGEKPAGWTGRGKGGGWGKGGKGGAPVGAPSYFAADYAVQPWTSSATYPSSIYVASQDKTYTAWLAEGGPQVIRIAEYDHATSTWSAPSTVGFTGMKDDSHGQPALVRDADGYLYCFYGSHGTAQKWAISDSPNDISSWTEQAALGGIYTYPKPVLVGSTIYLFVRSGSTGSSNLVLRTATPVAGAATFSAEAVIVNFSSVAVGFYGAEVRENGTDIEIIACEQSGGGRQHLYYFAYETTTGDVKNIDNTFRVVAASLPVTRATAITNMLEHTTATGQSEIPTWCRDTSGNLHVLFFNGTSDAGVTFDLYHAIYTTSWSTPTIVAALDPHGIPRIRYVSLVPGASGKVEAWYPKGTVGGWTAVGGDDMVRRVYDGAWGAEATIVTGDQIHALAHPTSVKDGKADFRVIFGESAQTESYNDRFVAKRYAHGDGGFINYPPLANAFWPDVVEQITYAGVDASKPVDLDVSWVSQPLTWLGQAAILSNRADFDGVSDMVKVGPAGPRRMNFTGGFYVFAAKCRWDSMITPQVIWACMGGANKRGISLHWRGDLSPKKMAVQLSIDSVNIVTVNGDWAPADSVTEYDVLLTRDASDAVRIHVGEADGPLSLVASGNLSGTIQASPTLEPVYHGGFLLTSSEMDGSIGGMRVIARDMGVTDADITPEAIADWTTN